MDNQITLILTKWKSFGLNIKKTNDELFKIYSNMIDSIKNTELFKIQLEKLFNNLNNNINDEFNIITEKILAVCIEIFNKENNIDVLNIVKIIIRSKLFKYINNGQLGLSYDNLLNDIFFGLKNFNGFDYKLFCWEILCDMMKNDEIKFPLKKYYISEDTKMQLMDNLKNFNSTYETGPNFAYNIKNIYFNKESFELFPTNKYILYNEDYSSNKKINLTIPTNNIDYYTIDIISDLFSEEERMKARRSDSDKSPWDNWYSGNIKTWASIFDKMFNKQEDFNTYYLREAVFDNLKECTSFKPTLAKNIYDFFIAKRVLDISAGWGDRLLGSIGSKSVQYYVATDPNINLKPVHDEIKKTYLQNNKNNNNDNNNNSIYSYKKNDNNNDNISDNNTDNNDKDFNNFNIIYEPFEYANLPEDCKNLDLVFTSPPFFDFEIYNEEAETQSINKYKKLNDWIINFLFASIYKAWQLLKNNKGYLALHITDVYKTRICEVMNLFIQRYCNNSIYLGVIASIGGVSNQARPIWIWKKDTSFNNDSKINKAELIMKKYFNNVYKVIKNKYDKNNN